MPTCFLDCEFTNFNQPELLSLGMVELAGAEHYVELDLETALGKCRKAASSEFVQDGGLLGLFGVVLASKTTTSGMGRRTGDWLLKLAPQSGQKVEVWFDCGTDWELTEEAIRAAGIWSDAREVVRPLNVGALTGAIDGELAVGACFRQLRPRGLTRHHALADALALRARYVAVKGIAEQATRVFDSPAFQSFVAFAAVDGLDSFDELRMRTWAVRTALTRGRRRPVDVHEKQGGLELLQHNISRIEHGGS